MGRARLLRLCKAAPGIGQHADGGRGYYAAFVIDPEGHNVSVAMHQ
jgi:hypothetical protein